MNKLLSQAIIEAIKNQGTGKIVSEEAWNPTPEEDFKSHHAELNDEEGQATRIRSPKGHTILNIDNDERGAQVDYLGKHPNGDGTHSYSRVLVDASAFEDGADREKINHEVARDNQHLTPEHLSVLQKVVFNDIKNNFA